MDMLVPSTLSKEEFWSRYFFRAHQITHEEERRKALIQGMSTLFAIFLFIVSLLSKPMLPRVTRTSAGRTMTMITLPLLKHHPFQVLLLPGLPELLSSPLLLLQRLLP